LLHCNNHPENSAHDGARRDAPGMSSIGHLGVACP
jgi:hypothetical protein